MPHTLFQAVAKGGAVDLRARPFSRDGPSWCCPRDYLACQALARSARAAGTWIIRYESVRDPGHGGCAAVLDCRAFSDGSVRQRQTWFLTTDRQRASWMRTSEARDERYEFVFG